MNRPEVTRFLKSFFTKVTDTGPFLELVLSLKRDLPLSIPLLRSLAGLALGKSNDAALLEKRMERRYRRLCRISNELSRLDLKKAAPGVSPGNTQSTTLEDFVFSQIDFSRYRNIDEKIFKEFFLEGLKDFDKAFFKKNFRLDREEVQSVIESSYNRTEKEYRLRKENPLILSIMRTLETSLESSSLFTTEELEEELQNLLNFVDGGGKEKKSLPGMGRLYPLLVSGLDTILITHEDGMTTKLFISPGGDLSGTFRPGDKPWTLVLIPAELIRR